MNFFQFLFGNMDFTWRYMGQTFGPIEGGIGLSIGRTYGSRLGEFIYACFAWYYADKYFSAQKFRFAHIIWY
jgi:hypothetical protein